MVQENMRESQPVERTSRIWRILAIIGIVLIMGLAVSSGTWVHTYKNLNASIQIEGNQIIIQNNDDYTWIDPIVMLNTDYTFNTSNILPHNKFAVNLNAFRKGNATDFFPDNGKPTDLYIYTKISQYQWSCWFYKF
jgi:hypothetical protein